MPISATLSGLLDDFIEHASLGGGMTLLSQGDWERFFRVVAGASAEAPSARPSPEQLKQALRDRLRDRGLQAESSRAGQTQELADRGELEADLAEFYARAVAMLDYLR